jgi:hypothetical protein
MSCIGFGIPAITDDILADSGHDLRLKEESNHLKPTHGYPELATLPFS